MFSDRMIEYSKDYSFLSMKLLFLLVYLSTYLITLVSLIEVPVRLFFFAFFPQPVCLIWVYVFNSFFKK